MSTHLPARVRLVCVGVAHLRQVVQLDLQAGRMESISFQPAAENDVAEPAPGSSSSFACRHDGCCFHPRAGREVGMPSLQGTVASCHQPSAHLAGGGRGPHVAGYRVSWRRECNQAARLRHAVALQHCGVTQYQLVRLQNYSSCPSIKGSRKLVLAMP